MTKNTLAAESAGEGALTYKGAYAQHLEFLANNRTVFPNEQAKSDFYRYIELWNTGKFWPDESDEFCLLRAKLKSLRLLPDRTSSIPLTGSVIGAVGEKVVRLTGRTGV